jgi:hypothetical protein
MDNPTTLLVAIMYVTIVATGLVNVLMTLSDIVGGKLRTDSIHTSWIVLMLLAYLSFFWETRATLDRYYFEQSARFFGLLGLVQVWIIGLDLVFQNVNYTTYLTGGIFALFMLLMVSRSRQVHLAVLAIVGLAFVLRIVLQAL